jgi:hypothetical protein
VELALEEGREEALMDSTTLMNEQHTVDELVAQIRAPFHERQAKAIEALAAFGHRIVPSARDDGFLTMPQRLTAQSPTPLMG